MTLIFSAHAVRDRNAPPFPQRTPCEYRNDPPFPPCKPCKNRNGPPFPPCKPCKNRNGPLFIWTLLGRMQIVSVRSLIVWGGRLESNKIGLRINGETPSPHRGKFAKHFRLTIYHADETGMREARRQTEQLAEYKILNLNITSQW